MYISALQNIICTSLHLNSPTLYIFTLLIILCSHKLYTSPHFSSSVHLYTTLESTSVHSAQMHQPCTSLYNATTLLLIILCTPLSTSLHSCTKCLHFMEPLSYIFTLTLNHLILVHFYTI